MKLDAQKLAQLQQLAEKVQAARNAKREAKAVLASAQETFKGAVDEYEQLRLQFSEVVHITYFGEAEDYGR